MHNRLRERNAPRWGTRQAAVFAPKHSARIIDAVLMALLVYRLPAPLVPADLPLAQLSIGVLIVVCLFRRPVRTLGSVRWYPAVCIVLVGFLGVSSLVNEVDFARRAANVGLLMLMAGFFASGRIDVASALKGIGVGLALNAVLFYAGVAPDSYQGVLTGFLQDKNVAGLVYGAAALLVSATTTNRWIRAAIIVAGGLGVFATDSRTSMAAFACGVIWIAVSPRLGLFFRAVIGLGIYLLFLWAEFNLATIGGYGLERAGSDAFRVRILEASLEKVQTVPWYGAGLGQATADLNGTTWFFHNSYLALLVEGGVVLLVGMLAIYLVAGFSPITRIPDSYGRHAVGGATIVVLLCATQLGEVFFSPIGFVTVGVGLALIAQETGRGAGDADWRSPRQRHR